MESYNARLRSSRILAVLLAVALAIRLWYLFAVTTPGFVWDDPDGYLAHALSLVRTGSWRWTFRAVEYDMIGRRHALPPLYSVFLSLFAPFPYFPFSARVAQACLGVVTVALVFDLGRALHSVRAGLVAATAYALWVPAIFGVWSTVFTAFPFPGVLS